MLRVPCARRLHFACAFGLAAAAFILAGACGDGADVTDEPPSAISESGTAPVFWRTTDEFASLREGEPYKVLFRITGGFDEESLRIDAVPAAGERLELEPSRADAGNAEDSGSYYPLTLELPAPGDWQLTVFAGDDEVAIAVQALAAPCEQPAIVSGRDPEDNQFQNGGFEAGYAPWCSLGTAPWGRPLIISQAKAQSGRQSALLELDSEGDARQTTVYGIVTEVAPAEFPEVLSGYYYVDGWEQGTATQYLQFVVIVWEADNAPAEVAAPNHQIRYVLAGVEAQPIEIANARFVIVDTGEPEQGAWVRFERNIREDFEELWGAVPEGFSRLRVLFEARWDGRTATDGPSRADVYYDDLYLGPSAGAP